MAFLIDNVYGFSWDQRAWQPDGILHRLDTTTSPSNCLQVGLCLLFRIIVFIETAPRGLALCIA